jgi:hypothetical protein
MLVTLFVPTPSETAILTALQAFLLVVLAQYGAEVVQSQPNRVPEPSSDNFVVMTPIYRDRLSTNQDTYSDVSFQASISGTTLTVSKINFGTIQLNATLFGTGVASSTSILTQLSGTTGGVGTYSLSGSAQNVSSEKMAAGVENVLQPIQLDVQLDVHSDDLATAGDMAQMISTLLRDDFAYQFFLGSYPGITALYADGPRQMPFVNDQQQVESRYVVTAALQADQVVVIPQQFADTLTPTSVPVDVEYRA